MDIQPFDIDKYLNFILGKESYVWDENSTFGNHYKIRITVTGEKTELGMKRPIMAVIVLHKLKSKDKIIRNTIAFQIPKTLVNVIQEINTIVKYSKEELKRKDKSLEHSEILEVILVPEEHYHKFLMNEKNKNKENDLYRMMGIPIPTYCFYLSEIDASDKEIAYLVELTRSVHHMVTLNKLLSLMETEHIQDESLKEQIEIEFEYPRIYIFVMMASHLREAIKLFWKFNKTAIYSEIKPHLLETQKENLEKLNEIMKEYTEERSFLRETLEFVRNQMFHYLPDIAKKWVKKIKEEEKEEKPRSHSINFVPLEMSLGMEFERFIYTENFLFSPEKGFRFSEFKKLIDLQERFISVVKEVINYIMDKSGIEKYRPSNWFLKYRYGYD